MGSSVVQVEVGTLGLVRQICFPLVWYVNTDMMSDATNGCLQSGKIAMSVFNTDIRTPNYILSR